MLRLMREESELKVVDDQVGSPTSVHTLTIYLFELIRSGAASGIYHWCDGGEISWFNFAQEIYQQGKVFGLIDREVKIQPISSSEYPTPATRPAYSVMDRSASLALMDDAAEDWKTAQQQVLRNLASQRSFGPPGNSRE